jgi:NTP pyrophosphatase (non-canonical NTP hydrolase)
MIDRKVFMDAVEYQSRTKETAIYRESNIEILKRLPLQDAHVLLNIVYVSEGLTGEAGEVSSLVKKLMRDTFGDYNGSDFREKMRKELGDCMWYISQMCNELDFSLAEIMQINLDKLQARNERGTLGGSGDER